MKPKIAPCHGLKPTTNAGTSFTDTLRRVYDLERERLVERYADPDHGVIKRVRLAPRGRQWAAEVRKAADVVERGDHTG